MKAGTKYLYFLLLILLTKLVCAQTVHNQNLEIGMGVQKNVMGIQQQYDITFRFSKTFGIGIFYQSSHIFPLENSYDKNPFTGVDLSSKIKSSNNICILAHIKGGFVNNQFFIITPELETRLLIIPHIYLGANMGIRRNQAAIAGKIIFTLF